VRAGNRADGAARVVPGDRAMTAIGGSLPGGSARNGLPEGRGYVYRGKGPFIADEER
jgi:hypothetical protein